MDQRTFRHVLSHFASGVTVITTCHDGQPHGITVSSFCSLSLDPPLVLICIDQRCRTHSLVQGSGLFAVNILDEDSEWLSRRFASCAPNKFLDVPLNISSIGVPLLQQALATLECRLVDVLSGGDHSIFVGEVVAACADRSAQPLLYHRSSYHHLI